MQAGQQGLVPAHPVVIAWHLLGAHDAGDHRAGLQGRVHLPVQGLRVFGIALAELDKRFQSQALRRQ